MLKVSEHVIYAPIEYVAPLVFFNLSGLSETLKANLNSFLTVLEDDLVRRYGQVDLIFTPWYNFPIETFPTNDVDNRSNVYCRRVTVEVYANEGSYDPIYSDRYQLV